MIKIPYGLSDFKGLILSNHFYQDRTQFIPILENWKSPFPVFLRPRRFGKSLFISMFHHYYGLEHKEDFQNIFGKLYIGQHPTENANQYMVLSLEFSRIDTATHQSTYHGFLMNVLYGATIFLGAYQQFFTEEQKQIIENGQHPEDIIKSIFSFVKQNKIPHKIYLLIDEYDHFANELLSFDIKRFKSDVSQNGFVRKFYETFKTATRDGIIERIFITGVSPVTLDALTSGFNISDNISLNPVFHDMMGFTHAEMKQILHDSAIPIAEIPEMMFNLEEWYDGYIFAPDIKNPLFNPDMVLYFLKEYSIADKYPYFMLDSNIISDYRKIRNIFKIGGQENEKFELLERLVKTGSINFTLTRIYNLEANFTHDDFLSLLYYMGMLTIKGVKNMRWRFQVPNYVIKKLYFEYFTSIFLEKTRFANTRMPLDDSIDELVNEANPDHFFKIIEHILAENHSNRDELVYGEKHLQTLMIGILYPYEAYYIHSEYESKRGYPDIFIEKMPDKPINYEIVLELKYVKKSNADKINTIVAEAAAQLHGYMTSERFSRPDVRGFYVVFLGGEVYQWKEYIPQS
jgi:Predicted AAA-ATPase/PD-(D/E)XK nuclease superfamily